MKKTIVSLIILFAFLIINSTNAHPFQANEPTKKEQNTEQNSIIKSLQNIYDIGRGFIEVAILLVGLFVGFRKLNLTLKENNLNNIIETIHNSDKETRAKAIDLLNDFIKPGEKEIRVTDDDLKVVYEKIGQLFKISGSSSKEISNYCRVLYLLIGNLIEYKSAIHLTQNELNNTLIKALNRIIELSSTVAVNPKKIKLTSRKILDGPETKYLVDNEINYYKGLRYGHEKYLSQALHYEFYREIKRFSNHYFAMAFFKITNNFRVILIQMLKEKFYMPPVLRSRNDDLLFGSKEIALFHIKQIKDVTSKEITFECFYSNFSSNLSFIQADRRNKELPEQYFDRDFPDSTFNTEEIQRTDIHQDQGIAVFTLKAEYVQNLFLINEKKIKKFLLENNRLQQISEKTWLVKGGYKIKYFFSDLLTLRLFG